MKEEIVKFLIKLVTDIVFGLLASIFMYFVIGEILPQMFSTQLKAMSGAFNLSISFDSNTLKEIFSIWHNFCILFGIRFIVAYVCGNYSFKE